MRGTEVRNRALHIPIRSGEKCLTLQTNNLWGGNWHPQDSRFRGSQVLITLLEPTNTWKKAFHENWTPGTHSEQSYTGWWSNPTVSNGNIEGIGQGCNYITKILTVLAAVSWNKDYLAFKICPKCFSTKSNRIDFRFRLRCGDYY
jgi:hypothetical protein